MTAANTAAGELGRGPGAVAPGDRGATRIADRVIAKIASRAAREAVGPLPPDADPPHATVVVHHDTARFRVHVELDYPADLGDRCARVRRRVTERVTDLVDLHVTEVAVQVERLHLTAALGAPRGRTR
ncbi:hypothetical protein [Streptomyces sp. enrichment culture]|uniref:hypothetical protein n=1 Tax=Streptomyces sp. enrichment culture TaxID=1795815 RepID=UPI003F561325